MLLEIGEQEDGGRTCTYLSGRSHRPIQEIAGHLAWNFMYSSLVPRQSRLPGLLQSNAFSLY